MPAFTRPIATLGLASLLWVPVINAPHAQVAPESFNPQDVIPVDSAVREGTLPNGLTFILKRNTGPAKRVSMRLAIKAGSLYEADDQQGLAHFIAHMAFNGSTNFKAGEVQSYFESVGAQMGPHDSASTGFDQTIYRLDLPTDRPDIVAKGLTALADFSSGLTLDPAQIDNERDVILEELSDAPGVASRLRDAEIPFIFYGSRYAERPPNGKLENIQGAPPEALRAFYDAWYRPERMAVVVVGDIDVPQMEAAIRTTFGPLKARGPALPQPDLAVPLQSELLVKVNVDPKVRQSSVRLIAKRLRESEQLVYDFQRQLAEQLVFRMFNERFSELAQLPEPDFLGASVDGWVVGRFVKTFEVSASTTPGGLEDGLTALAVEAKRVREFGFTAGELDRAKRDVLSSYERAYNERDNRQSDRYADEYLRHFFDNEPIPGIAYDYRLVQWALPTITLDDVTGMARERLADESRMILAVMQEKAGLEPPTESELQGALSAADVVIVTPWSDDTPATER